MAVDGDGYITPIAIACNMCYITHCATVNGHYQQAVADPGFPKGGGTNPPGGHQHTIVANFPKNCMKSKEFEPQGVHASHALFRSANDKYNQWLIL